MKKILFFFVAFSSLWAQSEFAPAFDYALFNYDDTSKYLEIYYSFPVNSMTSELIEGEDFVKGLLVLEMKKQEKELVPYYSDSWEFERNKKELSEGNLTGLISLQVPFGRYVVNLSGKDILADINSDSKEFELVAQKSDDAVFSISDLEIASDIIQFTENTESIFYKNRMEVIPNPGMVFGEGLPVLYFYCELYNLDKSKDSEKLRVDHQLRNTRNEISYSKSKYISRKSSSRVEIGAINIMDLPAGAYTINVSLTDTVSNKSAYSFRKIFVYNPEKIDTTLAISTENDLLATEFSLMDNEELKFVFSYSKYLATQNEIDAWEAILTVDGKRNYLYEFWKRRDPNPSTPENEARAEYLKRYKFANTEYSNIVIKNGYKTDMGRVYMIYGKPDDISRYPNESERVPYEIWRYNSLESGVIFVFADFNSLGNYRQIHSNKRGEISNRFWQQQINIEGTDYFSR
ncbi:MAG: hypothetical protein SCALA702_07080 [Melioribacteraceae bacterium]|nr:MAG: hypothetical protein SCALA702_07080 [Melioribacteraceae bacterium]